MELEQEGPGPPAYNPTAYSSHEYSSQEWETLSPPVRSAGYQSPSKTPDQWEVEAVRRQKEREVKERDEEEAAVREAKERRRKEVLERQEQEAKEMEVRLVTQTISPATPSVQCHPLKRYVARSICSSTD